MVRPAIQVTAEHLAEGGGFTLVRGSVLRVKLVTAQEADSLGGVAPGPAVPLFVSNDKEAAKLIPQNTQVDPGEPIPFRIVLDREPTSFMALPVYMEI